MLREKMNSNYLLKQTATYICMSCFDSLLWNAEHNLYLFQSFHILITEFTFISYQLSKFSPVNF